MSHEEEFTDADIEELLEAHPFPVLVDILREHYGGEIPNNLKKRILNRTMEIITGHKLTEIDEELVDDWR